MLLPNGSRDLSFPNFPYTTGGGKIRPWNGQYYVHAGHTVRRLDTDCLIDSEFIQMNQDPLFSSLQGGDYHVYPDGRVLMSGVHSLHDSIRGFEGLHCLVWFSNTGYLDTTQHHRTCAGSLDFFQALPDGRFIGSLGNPPNTASWEGQPTGSNVIRFDADGEWDPSFQADVWWGQAYGFLPLPDGRLYAGGNFRIAGDPDTLHFVRFMPDGSLDPTFNNHLDFRTIDLSGSLGAAVGRVFHQLDEGRLIITGGFELVDGEPRQGICLIDTAGNLLDTYLSGPGCGDFNYQGWIYGSIEGITPAPDGSYYIWGAYHGYDDGTTNDTLQRMVSRLHGLTVGVRDPVRESWEWEIFPVPVTDALSLRSPADRTGALVILRDALGRIVHEQLITGPETMIDVVRFAPGLYHAEVRSRFGQCSSRRWIKQ